jgi:integrase
MPQIYQPSNTSSNRPGTRQRSTNVRFIHKPLPHSLRHAFAINTLNQIKARGNCPQQALPVLATYMGHRKYQYTAAYLKVKDAKDIAGLIAFTKSQLDVI